MFKSYQLTHNHEKKHTIHLDEVIGLPSKIGVLKTICNRLFVMDRFSDSLLYLS